MAKCGGSLPDPIEARDAAVWPENVTTPALIDFGTGTSALVETFMHEGEPVARLRFLGVGATTREILLDVAMLSGLVAALRAAESELQAIRPLVSQ